MIFKEYTSDLHYPSPSKGDLMPWCKQGVLLWNVIPSCTRGKSLSHRWGEWEYLTKEILERLSERSVVFVALGAVAREHLRYVKRDECPVVEASHPSPRGNKYGRIPFLGSRIFTTTNAHLCDIGEQPVDWRLP
jgi:uracil-DNA glycosylase